MPAGVGKMFNVITMLRLTYLSWVRFTFGKDIKEQEEEELFSASFCISQQWNKVLEHSGWNRQPLLFHCYPKTFNHEKSLMFNYGRMQRKISSRLVCGSHGACLDCMLPGVQVTAGLGVFSALESFM